MPRERSTWNVNTIAKRAGLKVADPYLMNQDHVNQQPAADAYTIGGPSDFAEDVHPSNTTWEAEYAGGQVKRNEIGMPEMRSDTFNHPEKTASAEVITKKAALCVAIARKILPKTASSAEIEDQSYSFMYLPDAEVMSTYTRLAAEQEQQEQEQAQQEVQASQQGQQDQQGQQVQAGQIPPQFLENVKKKKEEAEEKDDDKKEAAQQDQGQQDQGQQKQAQQDQGQQDQGQAQQKQAETIHQGMQQQIAQLLQQAQQLQQQLAQSQQQQVAQVQQPVAQMQQQSQAQQVAQAVQQAIQSGQDPVAAAQQCMGQSQQQATSEIDLMLAEQGQIEPTADMDIQLDTPSMDTGEIQMSPGEDDTLRQLFANNPEYKNAQEAAGQEPEDQGQAQQKQAHVVRTASMRTVGTRPTAGVSQIGGVSSNAGAASGRDLSSIWNSAPDVRGAFGMRTDQ